MNIRRHISTFLMLIMIPLSGHAADSLGRKLPTRSPVSIVPKPSTQAVHKHHNPAPVIEEDEDIDDDILDGDLFNEDEDENEQYVPAVHVSPALTTATAMHAPLVQANGAPNDDDDDDLDDDFDDDLGNDLDLDEDMADQDEDIDPEERLRPLSTFQPITPPSSQEGQAHTPNNSAHHPKQEKTPSVQVVRSVNKQPVRTPEPEQFAQQPVPQVLSKPPAPPAHAQPAIAPQPAATTEEIDTHHIPSAHTSPTPAKTEPKKRRFKHLGPHKAEFDPTFKFKNTFIDF